MKSEFMIAVTQLAAEKKLPKETILKAVEAALVSAFKKESFAPDQNISVKIIPQTGEVKVYAQKTVVGRVKDSRQEISLSEIKKSRPGTKTGEVIEVEATPSNAGRIAAQAAKQVVLQKLREAERDAIFDEYNGKEGEIYSGSVQNIEPKQIIVDIGRSEAILPPSEQIRNIKYYLGQRLKVVLLEVIPSGKGPQVIVSRTHKNLVRRLFELEVPEIYNGVVELKAIARESGYRSKVAVATRQQGVEPVGCCVGPRGIRIQNIINELQGEKIDVIQWNADPRIFIANALSPAQVSSVYINENDKSAVVIVPDKQLSLAIGKEGQNARLAAKLTGWKIDIKSTSIAEAERVAREAEKAQAAKVVKKKEVPVEVVAPAAEIKVEEVVTSLPAEAEVKAKEPVPVPVAPAEEKEKPVLVTIEELLKEPVAATQPQDVSEPALQEVTDLGFVPVGDLEDEGVAVSETHLRFAEDLLIPRGSKQEVRGKKTKKKGEEDTSDHSGKAKKAKKHRKTHFDIDLEEEY